MQYIKSLCFIISFLLISGFTFADSPEKLCTITGIVSDSITGEGLPYASLQLYATDNEMLQGVLTDNEGGFSFASVKPGSYSLVASYMGYNTCRKSIRLNDKRTNIEFLLQPKSLSLETYEVTAEKNLVETTIEKTTINVAKNITAIQGTAREVMATLPSVDIDIDGNINYRGSDKVTVLINGKRSELTKTLDQIPAGQIEKVEMINNPSAKYEADGMSGIINIILKTNHGKNSKTTLMLNVGLPETFGGNAGFSQFREKSSLYVSGGYHHKTKFQTKEHLRSNYGMPDGLNYYQFDRMDDNINNAIFTSSYIYNLSGKQQIGFSITGSKQFNHANRAINYQTLFPNGDVESASNKAISLSLDNYNLESDIHYNLVFDNENHNLTVKAHYSLLDQIQKMENKHYLNEYDEPALQNTSLNQNNSIYDVSLDYSHPVTENFLFETGYSNNTRDLLNNFISESYNYDSGLWYDDPDLNNMFCFFQQINALYAEFSGNRKRFVFQGGVRAEYVKTSQNAIDTDRYIDLFPSATISAKIAKLHTIYAAFTSRINRPTIKMLNPYTDEYADIMNQHRGNPELKPEYVNSYEAGHRFAGKKITVAVSLYYRDISNAISRVKSASNDSALYVTFMNLSKAKMPGAEATISFNPYKWWNLNAGANIFNTTLVG